MSEPFSVPVTVRGYETDSLGHLNQSVYLQYAEHARWELLQAAGVGQAELLAEGIAPVVLETTIRYLRELRAGEDVEVSCVFEWGEGKTFRVTQTITKTDGTVSAEVSSVGGLLDLKERRLTAQPREYFKQLTTDPGLFGL
ncbi:acyl-CoA thioester hydrolase [Streptomyces sp. 3213]|uniref:acyl-CoA thioesterase n=1 Tax=Streptomyces sp. 3213.3 TaxID=1855348 RepID=UPI000898815A|nr:thioesterase family protein [Streptomyces sp. 3213.3]SEE71619.1 acyl-CoA thioester hydrolase [Streptomyces sp. 3213] [Streptomyces sp. 3213.3]